MGRITSERQMKNKGVITQDEYLLLSFTPISFLLYIVAMFGELYITLKYFGSDPYANYSLFLFILGFISFGGIIYLNKGGVIRFQYKFIKEPVIWLFSIVFLMFSLAISWTIAKVGIRYALSDTDLYFYYISTAVIEEMFFRMFLCSLLKIRFNLNVVVVILFTSVLFMLFHIEAYMDKPYALVVMFFGGVMFSVFYLYTKDITVTMVAHVIVNIFAVGNLLMVVH